MSTTSAFVSPARRCVSIGLWLPAGHRRGRPAAARLECDRLAACLPTISAGGRLSSPPTSARAAPDSSVHSSGSLPAVRPAARLRCASPLGPAIAARLPASSAPARSFRNLRAARARRSRAATSRLSTVRQVRYPLSPGASRSLRLLLQMQNTSVQLPRRKRHPADPASSGRVTVSAVASHLRRRTRPSCQPPPGELPPREGDLSLSN